MAEEDVRGEAERYNDEHIAPRLLALAKECQEHDIYFVSRTEWAPFEGQTTMTRPREGIVASFDLVEMASRANGNIDALILGLARAHNEGKLDLSQSMMMHWLKLPPFGRSSATERYATVPDPGDN